MANSAKDIKNKVKAAEKAAPNEKKASDARIAAAAAELKIIEKQVKAGRERVKLAQDETNEYKKVAKERAQVKEIEREIHVLTQESLKTNNEITDDTKKRIKVLKEEKKVIGESHSMRMDPTSDFISQLDSIKKIVNSSRDWTKALAGNVSKLDHFNNLALDTANSTGKAKELYDDIYNTQSSIMSMTKKSQMLQFDYESTLEEIADMEASLIELKQDQTKEGIKQANKLEILITQTKEWATETKAVTDEVKKTQVATDKLKEMSNGLVNSFESAELAAKGMVSAIAGNKMMAIAAAVLAAVKAFTFLNDQRKELQEGLGVTRATSVEMGKDLLMVGGKLALIGVDAKQVASELGNSFGDLTQVTPELVLDIGQMSKGLGISSATSATLVKSFKDVGGLTAESAVDMIKYGTAMAVANKVAPGKVMEDIAENTESFADYGKDGGKNMLKAAVAARKLGLNLATTAKIADSLLDFESSIEKEMEASMLIGKQLNFNKARELALSGDIAGAAADVMKQVGGQAEFEKMNVIQRRALADSIGVSTDELSKMTSGKGMKFDKMEVQEPSTEHFKNLEDSMKWGPLMSDALLSSENVMKLLVGAVIANTIAQTLGLWGKGGKGLLSKGGKKGATKAAAKLAAKSSTGILSKVAGRAGLAIAGKEALKKTGGTVMKSTGKVVTGAAAKAALKKGTAKVGAKALGKGLLKKIPGIGLIAGLGFAASRLMKGDGLGALAEVASGAASLLPGIGTAVSIAIDAGLAAKDIAKASKDANNVAGDISEEAKTETVQAVDKVQKVVETPSAKQEEVAAKVQTGQEMRAELDKEYGDLNKGQQELIISNMKTVIFEPFVEKMLSQLPQLIATQLDPIVKNNLVQTQEYLEVLQKVADNTGKTTSEIANLTV